MGRVRRNTHPSGTPVNSQIKIREYAKENVTDNGAKIAIIDTENVTLCRSSCLLDVLKKQNKMDLLVNALSCIIVNFLHLRFLKTFKQSFKD